ncbi:MAG: xanthine phosphoribosyltransferase [Eubacteriales bacterium]|nr:xanthine phosphoribosyltransferase [Eubacteriales bacterium]
MQLLKERIERDGQALSEHVLVVDSFLNHQVDAQLMMEIGREFAKRFAGRGIQRVATIESSGIAPAAMTALQMGVPLVVMKKATSAIMDNDVLLTTRVHSFTKNIDYMLMCKRSFLPAGEKVLFIDDFLANGEAGFGAARLIEEAGSEVAGIGIVIEKSFQEGARKLAEAGYDVHSLARIAKLSNGVIEFA